MSMSPFLVLMAADRHAPPVQDQSRVQLRSWRIVQMEQDLLLVGFLENGITCRLTSSIDRLDPVGREVTTQSGRLYELLGPPTQDDAHLAAIRARLLLAGCVGAFDVTDHLWSAMQSHTN